jgi:hypothetical protein
MSLTLRARLGAGLAATALLVSALHARTQESEVRHPQRVPALSVAPSLDADQIDARIDPALLEDGAQLEPSGSSARPTPRVTTCAS